MTSPSTRSNSIEKSNEIDKGRRNFLKQISSICSVWITWILTLPISYSNYEFIATEFINRKKETISISLENSVEIVSKKNNTINIWVAHITEIENFQLALIKPYLEKSDIILLEFWGYFDNIKKIYQKKWKKVFSIDTLNNTDTIIFEIILAAVIWLNFDIFKHNLFEKEEFQIWLKKYILLVVLSFYSPYSPSMVYNAQKLEKSDINNINYEKLFSKDFSYIIDARTVFMTEKYLQIRKKYPNKTISIITGKGHAKWIEYYLNHPKEFEKKLLIYTKLYALYKTI